MATISLPLILVADRSAIPIARQFFAEYFQPHSETIWESPPVLELEQWLLTVAEEVLQSGQSPFPTDLRRVLQPREELLVWEEILRKDLQQQTDFLRHQTLARTAQQTHRLAILAKDYLDVPATSPPTAMWTQFLGWQMQFEACCQTKGWWTEANLLSKGLLWLSQQRIPLPDQIWCVGFPPEDWLLSRVEVALQSTGTNLQRWQPTSNSSSAIGFRLFLNWESELRSAIQWLAEKRKQQPTARLALAVPNLSRNQTLLRRLLEEQLNPNFLWEEKNSTHLYRLGTGQPLMELKAFQVLNLWWEFLLLLRGRKPRKFPVQTISQLLRADFWRSEDSLEIRVQLDLQLRKLQTLYVEESQLTLLGQNAGAQHFCRLLRELSELVQQVPNQQIPSRWTTLLRQVRQQLGWHPMREWDEERELFQDLAKLDEVLGPISVSTLWTQTRRLLQSRQYYPPGEINRSALLVMEPNALLDLPLDGVWLCGMSEAQFLSPDKPNNMLPGVWQSQLGLAFPGLTQNQEHAEDFIARWKQQCPEVVFSCCQEQENREVRPSPWLPWPDHLEDSTVSAPEDPARARFASNPVPLDAVTDDFGTPMSLPASIAGGTAVLKAQALCPCKAYAEFRLGASHPEQPLAGLAATHRGNLIHWALEAFWGQAHRSSALEDEEFTSKLLSESIETALDRMDQQVKGLLTPNFRKLEVLRLQRVLCEWLALEKQRAPFEIAALEQKYPLSLAGLEFVVRIDRLDQLENCEGWILLDYKSGSSNSLGPWQQERLSEPQLPLYATQLFSDKLAALALAQVHNRGCAFKGIQKEKQLLPKAKRPQELNSANPDYTWDDLLADWQQRLNTVASEFIQGFAALSFPTEPRSSTPQMDQIFAYSGARGFCRVYETLLTSGYNVDESGSLPVGGFTVTTL